MLIHCMAYHSTFACMAEMGRLVRDEERVLGSVPWRVYGKVSRTCSVRVEREGAKARYVRLIMGRVA